MKPVLIDSGVIVALLDSRERYHSQCAAQVRDLDRAMTTCEAVIVESCHLLRRVPGAPERVLQNVEQGVFEIAFRPDNSASAVRAIMRKYRDLPASLADACLIHLADELNTSDILTLDSNFLTYRWRGRNPFRNLIDLDR